VCAGAKANRFAVIAKHLLFFFFFFDYSNLCTKIIKLDSGGGLLYGGSRWEKEAGLCGYNIHGPEVFSSKFELSLFVYLSSLFVVVFGKMECHENIYGGYRTGMFVLVFKQLNTIHNFQSFSFNDMQTFKTDGVRMAFVMVVKLMGYKRMVFPVEMSLTGRDFTGKQQERLMTVLRIRSYQG